MSAGVSQRRNRFSESGDVRKKNADLYPPGYNEAGIRIFTDSMYRNASALVPNVPKRAKFNALKVARYC